MKKVVNNIKIMLNNFRGVEVETIDLKNRCLCIEFKCQCLPCLFYIAGIQNICKDLELSVHSLGTFCNYFMLLIKEEDIFILEKSLNKADWDGPGLVEQFNIIPGMKKLSRKKQQKYINYVKFLREKYTDGLIEYSANEVLELKRFFLWNRKLFQTLRKTNNFTI